MKKMKSSNPINIWGLHGLRTAFWMSAVAAIAICSQASAAITTPNIYNFSNYVEQSAGIRLYTTVNGGLNTKVDGYSWVEQKNSSTGTWTKISYSDCLPTYTGDRGSITYDPSLGRCYWYNIPAPSVIGNYNYRVGSTDSTGTKVYSNQVTVTIKKPIDMPAQTVTFVNPPTVLPHNIPAQLISKVPSGLGKGTKLQWRLGFKGPGSNDWTESLVCSPDGSSSAYVIYDPIVGRCKWNEVNYEWGQRYGDYQFRVTTEVRDALRSAIGTTHTIAIKLPWAEPTTIASAVNADQTKRAFVGYYPSWLDGPWFNTNGMTNDQVLNASQLAKVPATYTHVMVSFAHPKFSWDGNMTTPWNTMHSAGHGLTGLNFTVAPKDTKRVIDVLHARKFKVLLAVGGASFNGVALLAEDWAALAAEGNSGTTGPITTALTKALKEVGFDGLDVDYELPFADQPTVDQYKGVILALRRAVDNAGGGKELSLAAWSTGADCIKGRDLTPCSGVESFWAGAGGRERKLFTDYPELKSKFSMVSIMSYDAGYTNYLAESAFAYYRSLLPSSTILNMGLETADEAWGGAVLTTLSSAALKRQYFGCTGSMRGSGSSLSEYSVERLLDMPRIVNQNPRDGGMLWHMMKTGREPCGAIANMGALSQFPIFTAASPRNILSKVSQMYGLPIDYRASAVWH